MVELDSIRTYQYALLTAKSGRHEVLTPFVLTVRRPGNPFSQLKYNLTAEPPIDKRFASTPCTVYTKKYAHVFVVLCFVVVMQSFIMNSHEGFIHIYQGCFAGTGAIVRLPQCQ